MLSNLSAKKKRRLYLFVFLAAVFAFIMCWACIQPLNSSPDESMRYDIVKYILNHGCLPDGRDPEIRNEIWGISYGFYPILAYMLMVIPAKIVSLFTTDTMAIVIAARLVNAIFGTLMAYFVFRISEMLFKDKAKYLFTVLVTFLPGVIFVHSYINNDSMAIFSGAWIIYAWIRSMKEGWTWKICVHLSLAIAVCALSYYNAYGYILCSIIFFFTTILIGNQVENKAKYVASRTALIVILVLALISWWFIRNYMLYDGDFLGWNVTTKYAEMYAMDGYKPSQRDNLAQNGYSAWDLLKMRGTFSGNWTLTVMISFVGTFGFLNILMPYWLSYIYLAVIFIGVIGIFCSLRKTFAVTKKCENRRMLRKLGVFHWMLMLMIIITIALLIYYNLYSDLQAQGRYLLPMAVPLMIFVTKGIQRLLSIFVKNEKTRDRIYVILSIVFIFFAVYTYITVFYPAYVS